MAKLVEEFNHIPSNPMYASASTAMGSVQLGQAEIPTWPLSNSKFPHDLDSLKLLNWTSKPVTSKVQQDLTKYYEILSKINAGTVRIEEIDSLKGLLPRIEDYVLTEKDYNTLASAVYNLELYILNYCNEDLKDKSDLLDRFLDDFTTSLNEWGKRLNNRLGVDNNVSLVTEAIQKCEALRTDLTSTQTRVQTLEGQVSAIDNIKNKVDSMTVVNYNDIISDLRDEHTGKAVYLE